MGFIDCLETEQSRVYCSVRERARGPGAGSCQKEFVKILINTKERCTHDIHPAKTYEKEQARFGQSQYTNCQMCCPSHFCPCER
jgi:hypothetical protein